MKIRNIMNVHFVTNNLLKGKKYSNLPIVTTPLITYYTGEYQDDNVEKILQFFRKKSIKIPEHLEPHSLTKTGWNPSSQTKIKNELDKALKNGDITQDEYTKYCSKVNFTGSPEISADDMELDSEYMMNPELEAIYHAPPIDTPEGLVKTIFGELPPGVDIDMDLWSSLKSMAKGVFGSWLE